MPAQCLQIENVHDLPVETFDEYVLRDQPVIIKNAIGNWPAFRNWTPTYLARKIGHIRVRPRISTNHVHPNFEEIGTARDSSLLLRISNKLIRRSSQRNNTAIDALPPDREVTFANFLSFLTSKEGFRMMLGSDELPVFGDGAWNQTISALRDDFELPRYFQNTKLESSGIWVSGKGVRSHLHYDGNRTHNLNAQVAGSKQVQLYPPSQMNKLYPFLFSDRRPHIFSQVDVENVDHSRFPLFREADTYVGTLEAGDMLLIPAYWYHTFKHTGEFNVNVNFWWHADFIRQSPVSVREFIGEIALAAARNAKIPPFWLGRWLREVERRIAGGTQH